MDPFQMVVAIVALVTIGSIIRAKVKNEAPATRDDPEAARLKDEIRQLRDRVQVLERVITDTHSTATLDREIDQLRDRDRV